MDGDDLVTVSVARMPELAEMTVERLAAEGIPAVVHGANLMDDWAMTRKLAGMLACEVKVRRADLEAAREALGLPAVEPTKAIRISEPRTRWYIALVLAIVFLFPVLLLFLL
jgi:hypothetical protein